MMTPPFIMNSGCFGPKLSLFFLSSLPFKFGFKCAHMHTHTHLLSSTTKPRREGGGKGAGRGGGSGGPLAVSCVDCSVPAAFQSLQISLPASEHQGIEGGFETWQALSAYVRACAMKHENLFPYQSD